MSVRHFTRVFTSEVGESPGRFVERVRLEAARRDLETSADTLDVIADRCGFGTAETLRRVFQRRMNVAPDSYRRRFRVVALEGTSAMTDRIDDCQSRSSPGSRRSTPSGLTRCCNASRGSTSPSSAMKRKR